MKLKKHLELFCRVMCRIIEQRNIKRFRVTELTESLNKDINDKRLVINNRQLSKIIKHQDKYIVKKNGDKYEFK